MKVRGLESLISWKLVTISASLLVLSACFHAEDDGDEIIGSWERCTANADSSSSNDVITFDEDGEGMEVTEQFASADCSGDAVSTNVDRTFAYDIDDDEIELNYSDETVFGDFFISVNRLSIQFEGGSIEIWTKVSSETPESDVISSANLVNSWQSLCWTGDDVEAGVGSEHQVITFDSEGGGTIAGAEYVSTNCGGTPADSYSFTITYTLDGNQIEIIGSAESGVDVNTAYSILGSVLSLGDEAWAWTISQTPIASTTDISEPVGDDSIIGSWERPCEVEEDNSNIGSTTSVFVFDEQGLGGNIVYEYDPGNVDCSGELPEPHGGPIEYSVDGDSLEIVFGDEGPKTATIVSVTETVLTLSKDGEVSVWAAIDDLGIDFSTLGPQIVSDVVAGAVSFEGGVVPGDAWVRIVPNSLLDFDSIRCPIASDGTFGDDCFIDKEITTELSDALDTYQVVVYKEHLQEDQGEGNYWNCGEDVYRFVGENEAFESWSSIQVLNSDYEDRSGDTCDGS